MTEKRYFKKMVEEEYYIFDSNTISESDFEKKFKYQDYKAFEDSMMGDEVVNRLNELSDENEQLKQELIELKKWKNYEVNKYPDDEYLDKLFEKATLDFKETKESFNELKAEYKQKRNE